MNCNEILNDFIKYVFDELSTIKQINVERLPKIILTKDKSQTSTLAHFDTQNIEIVVYVKDRLLADICRSLAHEIVHFFQLEKKELYNNAGDTGSDIENEANSLAGIIMRNYSKINPQILVTPYISTKKSVPTLSGDISIPNLDEINKKLEEEIKTMYKELLTNTGIDPNEPKKEVHEFGCLMLQLDIPKWNYVLSQIDDEDLYTEENDSSYGKEDEPHVTVLYGFSENVDVDKIEQLLQKLKNPIEVTFTKIDLFENDKFDVVKFNVESPVLHKLHNYFKKNFENSDKYPSYQPHATIAYVKKGMGKKYVKRLKEPITFKSDIFKYSKSNGEVVYIEPYNVDRPLMECDCENSKEYKLDEGSVKSSERVNIYRDSRYTIVSPLSHKASCKYGANSKWCVSTPSSSKMYDASVSLNKKYIIIIDKQPVEKYTDDEIEHFEELSDEGDRFSQLFVRIYNAMLYDEDAELQDNEIKDAISIITKLFDFSKLNIRFYSNKYSIWTADNFNITNMFGIKLSHLNLPNQALNAIKEYMSSFDKSNASLNECDCEEYDVPDSDFDKTVDWLKGIQQNGQLISEAEYKGKKVPLNKPMRGDVKKFKVYVKGKDGRVVKVNFGSKDYNIKKNNPDRKKSYCSRSKGIKGGGKDRTKANYWSRRAWNC
jgi:2'-5' RNA ligase